ncbi:MAG: NAD(P)-dependent oxidoreductase [Pseudomonadales bacterium]|nr:NAD(P)-dependent oxidoreductase [Pseudomonadales bacterium]
MKKIGVVGLGNIGAKAATNLLAAGFDVIGFDIVPNADFVAKGGNFVASVEELAKSVDVVIHSLPAVSILVKTVDELIKVSKPGQVVIDISSYPLADKKAQAERLAEQGIAMLDCEISGLPFMLSARTAVIFQSGDLTLVESLKDVFQGLTEKCFYLGEFGAATKMKLLANAMVFVHNMMGAEILNLAKDAALDPEMVFDVLKQSASGSTTFSNKAPLMLSRQFESGAGPFRHMFHYMSRVSDLAAQTSTATPLINTALAYAQRAEQENRHDQDIAAMIEMMEQTSASQQSTTESNIQTNHPDNTRRNGHE